ncbi:MAG: ABC transporter substrate-binding protein [Nitrospinae bacterium CG11_big_fil_rev_8_21_14_0_20_56_8]|nr:MAG: ABC transporter substrate-binding protein [Nitrospinae bacterium CG11_big_fil_rev_8_21_14_0_20_56_8]
MYRTILALLILLLTVHPVMAKPLPGLSLYGPSGLKYKADEPYDYSSPKAKPGGHLVLADFGAFTKLNPASLKGVTAPGIGGLVFQTPMDSSSDDDEPFSQYGNMVETADLADDRMTLIYHLYKTARWSDGQPVTADDFLFSFDLLKDPEYHPIYKQYFKDIKKVEKIDPYTVKYTFNIFNQELPLITGQMIIFPKHIYGQKEKKFGADFDNIAVGSGPYVVDRYEFGKFITLKRNPGWWGNNLPKNRGRYNFEKITWKIFLDPVAMREGFKGGSYDAELIGSSRDWALDYQGDFVQRGYYLREKIPHKRVAGMQGFVMNMRNPLFQSRKTRAAVALVFDFDWSNKNLFYNQYTRSECYFDNNPEMKPKGLPEGAVLDLLKRLKEKYSEDVPKTVFTKPVGAPGEDAPLEANVRTANALLDSEGWKIGPDGIRVRDGQRFSFTLILASPDFMRISEPYKNNLKKIGVDMDMKVVQIAEYEQKLREFSFDMVVANYPQSRSPGNEQRYMWSSEAAKTPGSRNYMGIQNRAIDDLIDITVAAKTRKELVDAIQAMDRILTHQFYIVPQWYIGYDRLVYWNKFSRPEKNPSQAPIVGNIIEWWWWDEEKAQRLEKARKSGKSVL